MSVPSNLIPTRITQLQDTPTPSADGLLPFVLNGVTYKVRAGDLLDANSVPVTREVNAGTGLTGGGALSSDVTLSVAAGGIGATQLNTTGVTAASYGNSKSMVVLTIDANGRITAASTTGAYYELPMACSDETTALTTGTAKITFRMTCAVTLSEVRASLTTAQASGSIFTVDINKSGTSILSTKLTIDNAETTSVTATTPAVISDASLADNVVMTVDIDQIGNGTATGLKIYLIGQFA